MVTGLVSCHWCSPFVQWLVMPARPVVVGPAGRAAVGLGVGDKDGRVEEVLAGLLALGRRGVGGLHDHGGEVARGQCVVAPPRPVGS